MARKYHKQTARTVAEIRYLRWSRHQMTGVALAKRYHTTPSNIHYILKHHTWAAAPAMAFISGAKRRAG